MGGNNQVVRSTVEKKRVGSARVNINEERECVHRSVDLLGSQASNEIPGLSNRKPENQKIP